MYATQVKVKWTALKWIVDLDDKFAEKEAQVIILFADEENNDTNRVEFTKKNQDAYTEAKRDQKNNETISLDEFKAKHLHEV